MTLRRTLVIAAVLLLIAASLSVYQRYSPYISGGTVLVALMLLGLVLLLATRADADEDEVLVALLEGEANPHEIIERIARLSNGIRRVGHASVFPLLLRLEREALVRSAWGAGEELGAPRPRVYQLTELGRQEAERLEEGAGVIRA